jgi:hypothetical protein
MSSKIAVFSETYLQYKELGLFPKKNFKRITNINQVEKYHFIGVILIGYYFDNQKVCDAFYEFEMRYPYLFK